jgi:superfamily II DNA or RNA helicase
VSAAALALRPYQIEAIGAVRDAHRRGISRAAVVLPTGCHRAGQHILMFDGHTMPVEDVQVGDLLMGPDSTAREVLALARGTGPMLEIRPVKGEPWVVNDEHVLTLVETQEKSHGRYPSQRGGTIRDVALPDWNGWSKNRKHRHKLFRVGVDFPELEQPLLDPYFVGVVLGDGSLSVASRVSVATVDPEVVQACRDIASHYGLRVRVDGRGGIQHHIVGNGSPNGRRGGSNDLVTGLQALGLLPIVCADRFIPDPYRLGSRQVRLEVLAGLLDSDGALSNGGFDYGSKSERLAGDVAFVARSLGLAAYVTKRPSGHYRVSISGDCSVIPTRIPRKRAAPRAQKKDHLRTGFTVEPTGTVEPYYGFTLDGDQRYLLDDFTVTHNSGKTVTFGHLAATNPGRTLVLAHREELIHQAHAKLTAIAPGLRPGIEMASRTAGDAQAVVGSIQSMASERRLAAWPRDAFSLIVVDEAHHAAAQTYVTVMQHFGCYAATPTVGFTATLARGDGVGLGGVWQDVVYEKSLLQMITEGYLVNPRGLTVPIGVDMSQAKVSAGDYTAGSVGAALEDAGFEQGVAKVWAEHARGRATIVFCPTVATAQAAAEALRAAGARARAVWGAMDPKDREEAVAGLADGSLDVLANCQILTEGTDIPRAEVAIMARPTRSQVLFTQMIGRVLRPFPGKTDALVIDLVGGTRDQKLCTLIDLAAGELPDRATKPKPKDGETLVEAVERATKVHIGTATSVNLFGERRANWLQTPGGHWFIPAPDGQVFVRERPTRNGYTVAHMARGAAEPIPLGRAGDLDLAMALGEEHAARMERTAARERAAATGVSARVPATGRFAAWRTRAQPSPKQLATAARHGITVPEGATAGQVSDLIAIRFAERIDRFFDGRDAA